MPRLPKNTDSTAAVPPSDSPLIVIDSPSAPAAPTAPADEVVLAMASTATRVKARVLVACAFGNCNDVIELDCDVAEMHPDLIDTNSEAVAYAESLNEPAAQ